MIHCLMGIGGLPPDRSPVTYALLGLGESLNCIAFSVMLISTSVLITTIGTLFTRSDA